MLLMAIIVAIFSLLGGSLVLVVFGTMRNNRWGINLESNYCPRCKQPMPRVSRPASLNEALWGGGTCQRCGCKLDKWGREILSG
jgi:hypothetical protein